jgi:preprotein translocase subunit SecB
MAQSKDVGKTDRAGSQALGDSGTIDPEKHNRLVDAAELEDIKLVSSSFSIEPDYFNEQLASEFTFKIDAEMGEPTFDADARRLFASFEYTVAVSHNETTVLRCTAAYLVIFLIDGEHDEQLMQYFAKRVGRNASYPYFREYSAAQSWASGANLPILPIMKTGSVRKRAADVSGIE